MGFSASSKVSISDYPFGLLEILWAQVRSMISFIINNGVDIHFIEKGLMDGIRRLLILHRFSYTKTSENVGEPGKIEEFQFPI